LESSIGVAMRRRYFPNRMPITTRPNSASAIARYAETARSGHGISRCAAEDLEAAFEVALDEFELLGGVTRGVFKGSGGETLIETANALESLKAGANKDFAAVARVAEALDEAGFFEAVENTGDGAGGETGVAGKIAGGEGSLRITGH